MSRPVRRVIQPGPAHPVRVESCAGPVRSIAFRLEAGLSLNEAVSRPLRAAGLAGAMVEIGEGRFSPLIYVLPALSPDASHAAYYSEIFSRGEARLECANVTFGNRAGAPFIHCHAIWEEADGVRRGGHIMPHETILATDMPARAWGSPAIAIESDPDPETNFTLFHPVELAPAARSREPRLAVIRVRPYEDITEAAEAVCRTYGFRSAVVRSSIGSLIGAEFADGRVVEDVATELLVHEGAIAPDSGGELRGSLQVTLVDTQGKLHHGRLVRGRNPVCITFELAIEEVQSQL